jgi:hypothetical protein
MNFGSQHDLEPKTRNFKAVGCGLNDSVDDFSEIIVWDRGDIWRKAYASMGTLYQRGNRREDRRSEVIQYRANAVGNCRPVVDRELGSA